MAASLTDAAWWSANGLTVSLTLLLSYAVGSIPWAYTIVRAVTGEDVTEHGSGNVGAMNVRRTTGSWGWFVVAMVADIAKGVAPVALAKSLAFGSLLAPSAVLATAAGQGVAPEIVLPMAATAGTVLGHNYSAWLAIKRHRLVRTGKGLATGAGALLAYDWRYFLAVVVVGLAVIALTRYMMAGQVVAAFTLPITAVVLGAADWPFALLMGVLVYAAHHRRFLGLIRGSEPKLYIDDGAGPRG